MAVLQLWILKITSRRVFILGISIFQNFTSSEKRVQLISNYAILLVNNITVRFTNHLTNDFRSSFETREVRCKLSLHVNADVLLAVACLRKYVYVRRLLRAIS